MFQKDRGSGITLVIVKVQIQKVRSKLTLSLIKSRTAILTSTSWIRSPSFGTPSAGKLKEKGKILENTKIIKKKKGTEKANEGNID